jgi:hypothetical protein
MSVSSASSVKVERYNTKYDNMKVQLAEMDNKQRRLLLDIGLMQSKLTTKTNTLKDNYETKMAYYKKCMEECEIKYKRDCEDNSKKMNDKTEKLMKELDKSKTYRQTIKDNIKSHLLLAKKHGIDLEETEETE